MSTDLLSGIGVHPFTVPLRRRFRGVTHREGVLLEGPEGWGEFSPFPDYEPPYTGRWLRAALAAATAPPPPTYRERIPVNVTIPAVAADVAHEITSTSGCMTAKVKVAEPGQTHDEDLGRVEAVRDALGPGGRIRVDANAAWDVDTAARRLRDLDRFDLEYAEQPVGSLEEMAALRRLVNVRLAVDEPIRLADDPIEVARRLRPGVVGGVEAADVIIVKAQPLGGVEAALAVAEAAGLQVVVSSALETSVGLGAGLALAAALPSLGGACGLATGALLDSDVVAEPLLPVDGVVTVRRPTPDPERLARLEPVGEDRRRILERLEGAARAGGGA